MTMKLELAPEVQAGLLAQAQASGLSLEEYAEKVLRERAEETMVADSPNEPFWKSFTRQVHALPDDVSSVCPRTVRANMITTCTARQEKRVTAVFADTFYWMALTNKRDSAHRAVMDYSANLAPRTVVTSDEVLTELCVLRVG